MTLRPEVRRAFRLLWHEIEFHAFPAAALLTELEGLVPLALPRSPSSGRPGRHAKHGRYAGARGAAAEPDGEGL
jgi:hypothetical protein